MESYCVDNQDNDFSWLEEASENYLRSIMVAGEILQQKTLGDFDDEIYTLNGKYACNEMIGQMRYEEIVNDYGT